MPDPKESPEQWAERFISECYPVDKRTMEYRRFSPGGRHQQVRTLATIKRDADDYRRLLRSLTLEDPAVINRVTAGIINLRPEGVSNA